MTTDNPTLQSEKLKPIYVASRASIPERGQMWRGFRDQGWPITSSWIDEDGEGQTGDFSELWERITNEIRAAGALVLYAEAGDFPLKGAFIEAGIALGMGKPVIVCLPDLGVLPRNYRPIGSWIAHPLVTRCDNINAAVRLAQRPAARVSRVLNQVAATLTPVEQEQENRGIKSSALLQRYARMWSSTEGIEKRFSLQDRYIAVRTCVHAIDRLAERDDLPFDVRANAQGILRDGIYNALDHRATGREWRNIRHTYWNERDGPYPPTEAEEDRRCERCGAIRPEPFTHCHAKNHVPAVAPSPSVREAAREAAEQWFRVAQNRDFNDDAGMITTLAAIIERHCSPVSAAPALPSPAEDDEIKPEE